MKILKDSKPVGENDANLRVDAISLVALTIALKGKENLKELKRLLNKTSVLDRLLTHGEQIGDGRLYHDVYDSITLRELIHFLTARDTQISKSRGSTIGFSSGGVSSGGISGLGSVGGGSSGFD